MAPRILWGGDVLRLEVSARNAADSEAVVGASHPLVLESRSTEELDLLDQ